MREFAEHGGIVARRASLTQNVHVGRAGFPFNDLRPVQAHSAGVGSGLQHCIERVECRISFPGQRLDPRHPLMRHSGIGRFEITRVSRHA